MLEFGSLAAGDPQFYSGSTITPTIVQMLSNYLTGWYGAVVGANSPTIQDMNSLCFLYAYQLAYLMQAGVPEYDSGTTYYKGSLAQDGAGNLFIALVDGQSAAALNNPGFWKPIITGGFNPQITQALAERIVSGWTSETLPGSGIWNSVVWSNEKSLFVAVANDVSVNIATSPDGKTWTQRTASSNADWSSVVWAPELGLFVAVANNNASTSTVMTSPDGTTWTGRTAAAAKGWSSVCWAPEIALLVAVSDDGAVMTSPDGIAWTSRTAAATNIWGSVCWSPSLQLFVAVSSDGTNRVMTSSDGTTWTPKPAAAAKQWTSVCWSEDQRQFVATAFDVGIMTSYDGSTWTTQTAPTGLDAIYQIVWSPETGMFVAVAAVSTATHIIYSFDGITWTDLSTGIADNQVAITWSAQVGLFVTLPNSATDAHISRYVQKFISA